MGAWGGGFGVGGFIPHHFGAIVKFDYNWYFRVFTSGIEWDFFVSGLGVKVDNIFGVCLG